MRDRTSPAVFNQRLRRVRALRLPGEVLVDVGQTVTPDTPVARARLLAGSPYVIDIGPDLRGAADARIEVAVGERVRAGDIVARGSARPFEVIAPIDGLVEYLSRSRGRIYLREEPGSEREQLAINIVEDLRVWRPVAWMHVRVRVGDEIEEGQILAAAPGVDGANYAYSPFAGVVERFDRPSGTIIVRRRVEEYAIGAFLAGTVTALVDGRGVEIEGDVAVVEGVYGRGSEVTGPLRVIADAADLAAMPPRSVVALTGRAAGDTGRRAAEMGVAGLLVGGLDRTDLRALEERDSSLPVVMVSGFGRIPMPREIAGALASFEGHTVSVDGAAGHVGQVLLPGPLGDATLARGVAVRRPAPGDVVRLLAPDSLGDFATVSGEVGLHRYPSGMEFDSIEVRDQRAEARILPVANVELWARLGAREED